MRFDFNQGNLVEAFVRQWKSRNGWLDEIDQLIDWSSLETLFDSVYASREGAASYPILVYIKLLFIQQWHGLSDEQLEAAVDDRLSFRRFRQHLGEKSEDGVSVGERLLAAINAQLDARGVILRKGTLIDATIVAAAVNVPKGDAGEVSELDPDAGFTKKNGETHFGYKAHAAVGRGLGFDPAVGDDIGADSRQPGL